MNVPHYISELIRSFKFNTLAALLKRLGLIRTFFTKKELKSHISWQYTTVTNLQLKKVTHVYIFLSQEETKVNEKQVIFKSTVQRDQIHSSFRAFHNCFGVRPLQLN